MINKIKEFANKNYEEALSVLRDLCAIPAPSWHEEERAIYCKNYLEKLGAKGVYIDEALNTVYEYNCEGSSDITVFEAHTDTVFPDLAPLPYEETEDKIFCPGVHDDTANVVGMLMIAKFYIENNIPANGGILFVCNSGEEGLGNLKGTRKIFENYKGRVKQFVTFDSRLLRIVNSCVGSTRYEVTVTTDGGHSFNDFGKNSAIAELASIVNKIYAIEIPAVEGSVTTLNVGTITGGTSVNTIAQNASMLCEYRSNSERCMGIMKQKFYDIFSSAEREDIKVDVKVLGERPCASEKLDMAKQEKLTDDCTKVIEDVMNDKVSYAPGSTDCNIPLSLAIPAISVGLSVGGKMHTREEWLDKSSLIPGMELGIRCALEICK